MKQGGQQRHETALTQIYSNQLNAITLPVLPQACWKSECEPTPLRVWLGTAYNSCSRSNDTNGVCHSVHDCNKVCWIFFFFFCSSRSWVVSVQNQITETKTDVLRYLAGCANNKNDQKKNWQWSKTSIISHVAAAVSMQLKKNKNPTSRRFIIIINQPSSYVLGTLQLHLTHPTTCTRDPHCELMRSWRGPQSRFTSVWMKLSGGRGRGFLQGVWLTLAWSHDCVTSFCPHFSSAITKHIWTCSFSVPQKLWSSLRAAAP